MQGIQTVRRSRGGDLIIEMDKGAEITTLEESIKNILGEEQAVRKLTPKITVEIKDLDPTVEKEELAITLARTFETEINNVEVKTIRYAFGGIRTAIVNIPAGLNEKIKDSGKIKIGFTVCRINRAINIIRCFRCHEFGHLSYACKENTEGKEICRRCGGEGHQMQNCQSLRCCILCIRKGIPAVKADHVAGAVNCPQYREFVKANTSRI